MEDKLNDKEDAAEVRVRPELKMNREQAILFKLLKETTGKVDDTVLYVSTDVCSKWMEGWTGDIATPPDSCC